MNFGSDMLRDVLQQELTIAGTKLQTDIVDDIASRTEKLTDTLSEKT